MADFKYIRGANQWVHPETGVRINDEDMPWELKPATDD
jgi:hypothetical protein